MYWVDMPIMKYLADFWVLGQNGPVYKNILDVNALWNLCSNWPIWCYVKPYHRNMYIFLKF